MSSKAFPCRKDTLFSVMLRFSSIKGLVVDKMLISSGPCQAKTQKPCNFVAFTVGTYQGCCARQSRLSIQFLNHPASSRTPDRCGATGRQLFRSPAIKETSSVCMNKDGVMLRMEEDRQRNVRPWGKWKIVLDIGVQKIWKITTFFMQTLRWTRGLGIQNLSGKLHLLPKSCLLKWPLYINTVICRHRSLECSVHFPF